MFENYAPWVVLLRRVMVVAIVALSWPCVFLPKWRSQYGSYLHRMWIKKGQQPVWLMTSEQVNGVYQDYC